jgi:murein DD-endopeptidase MepM/ murein hydrolase activator NlpD
MTMQSGGDAPGLMAPMWRGSPSAVTTAKPAIALGLGLGLGACAPALPGQLATEQWAKLQEPPPVVPATIEPVAAVGTESRLIAVLPCSKPAGQVREQPLVEASWPASLAIAATGYLWPVQGRIARAFGTEPSGRRSDGLDISAPEGAPVLAAEAGVVAYAGNELEGYGNMLLIEHADGFTTVYAHNRALLVRVGTTVRRGEVIATVGRSGGIADPQLHFQLRAGNTPIDPTPYLVSGATVLASVDPGLLPGLGGE